MAWSERKDILLMREIGAQGVFDYKAGSRERGNAWQVVADNLNQHEGFEVTARSVRDRFSTISKKQKAKNAKDLKATGEGGAEPTENELLIEELNQLSEDSERKSVQHTQAVKVTAEAERQKATEIRQKAMESMGESRKRLAEGDGEKREKKQRRTGSDTVAWLMEKTKMDAEFRHREVEIQQKHREDQAAERNKQMELFNNMFRQQMEQSQQQQQQQNMMQQQMVAMLQQQQQQTQMLMKLFNTKRL